MTAPATYVALQRVARPLRARATAGWLALALGARGRCCSRPATWVVRLEPARSAVLGAGRVGWRDCGARRRRLVRVADARVGSPPVGWPGGSRSWARGGTARSRRCSTARRRAPAARCWIMADRLQADELARRGVEAAEPVARPVRALAIVRARRARPGTGGIRLGRARARPRRRAVAPAARLGGDDRPGAGERRAGPRGSRRLRRRSGSRRSAAGTRRCGSAAPGEGWRARGVSLDSLGQARTTTGPLQSDMFARVTSGARSSDTVFDPGTAAGVPREPERHRPLSRVPGSRGRARAHRRRHAAASGRHPAGDAGRGDRAARERRRGPPAGGAPVSGWTAAASAAASCRPPPAGTVLALATESGAPITYGYGAAAGPARGRQRTPRGRARPRRRHARPDQPPAAAGPRRPR